jgi:transcriptional regulator GlxA family with amidase domain
MGSRLSRITDWPERARAVNYNATALAKACAVTRRTLERFFLATTGKTPHDWMVELRLALGCAALNNLKLVKEAAAAAGYEHPASFTRRYKSRFGMPPSQAG